MSANCGSKRKINKYMSRIGKTPIRIPTGITVNTEGQKVSVSGPKGKLEYILPEGMSLSLENSIASVNNTSDSNRGNALHGLSRACISNMVQGVSIGWSKTLELVGVGYRATLNGSDIVLSVGYSHTVTFSPPDGVTFTIQEGKIIVSGCDKQLVGQVAAKIKEIKKPEPYKGKGIRYSGEYVRKKAGKAKAVGGTVGK